MIWSNVEIGLGIITACVSMMRPLLRRMNILISEYGQPTSRNAQSMTWKSGPSSKRTTFQSRSHEYGSQLEDLPTLPRKPRAIVVRNSVEITSSHMRQMQSSSQESILAPHYHASMWMAFCFDKTSKSFSDALWNELTPLRIRIRRCCEWPTGLAVGGVIAERIYE